MDNHKQKENLLLLTVVTSFIALIPSAYVAYVSGSVTLFADFSKCSVEFLAIFISWKVLQKTKRSDESTYNFGLGKLEHLASISVSVALFIAFLVAYFSSVGRFINPAPLDNVVIGIVFAGLSVFGNLFILFKSIACLRKEKSLLIESQKKLFQAKALASTVVLFALLGSYYIPPNWGSYYLDPIGSLFISFFLLHSAYKLISSSMDGLLDRSIEEAYQLQILKILFQHEENYQGFRRIRSRFSGNKHFVQIYLEFEAKTKIETIDKAIINISKDINHELPKVDLVIVPCLLKK